MTQPLPWFLVLWFMAVLFAGLYPLVWWLTGVFLAGIPYVLGALVVTIVLFVLCAWAAR